MPANPNPSSLEDEPFSYWSTKDGKVFIQWEGKQVTTLKGTKAARFLAEIEASDSHAAQLLMARLTGNFKHGNERSISN